jgi:hypothetical protein
MYCATRRGELWRGRAARRVCALRLARRRDVTCDVTRKWRDFIRGAMRMSWRGATSRRREPSRAAAPTMSRLALRRLAGCTPLGGRRRTAGGAGAMYVQGARCKVQGVGVGCRAQGAGVGCRRYAGQGIWHQSTCMHQPLCMHQSIVYASTIVYDQLLCTYRNPLRTYATTIVTYASTAAASFKIKRNQGN